MANSVVDLALTIQLDWRKDEIGLRGASLVTIMIEHKEARPKGRWLNRRCGTSSGMDKRTRSHGDLNFTEIGQRIIAFS